MSTGAMDFAANAIRELHLQLVVVIARPYHLTRVAVLEAANVAFSGVVELLADLVAARQRRRRARQCVEEAAMLPLLFGNLISSRPS